MGNYATVFRAVIIAFIDARGMRIIMLECFSCGKKLKIEDFYFDPNHNEIRLCPDCMKYYKGEKIDARGMKMSKLLRSSMECCECGILLKKVKKKNFKKWDLGEIFFLCKDCRKK